MDIKQEGRNKLADAIVELLRSHRLLYTTTDDGDGYPLVDALTPPGESSISIGISEIELLAGEIAWLVIPAETPQPLTESILNTGLETATAEKTFFGYPISWFDECDSYLNADGVVNKDGTLGLPDHGGFILCFRMKEEKRELEKWKWVRGN